jgi:DNA-binding transcriptional LysR family regulator
MVRFEDLRIFVAAADHGSFSAAARELDVTSAVASAALKRLELTLDARLFVRSTRSLRLTTDGERYLEYARSAIATLEAGKNAMARDKTAISGTLSVSIPSDLGRHVLLPWLDDFQTQYPRVSFQVRISDRLADLYRQPVDIAIRYGTPNDSALVWRCRWPNTTAASCARRPRTWRVTACPRPQPICVGTTACRSCWARRCTTVGLSNTRARR